MKYSKQLFFLALLFAFCIGSYAQDRVAQIDSLFAPVTGKPAFNGNVLIAEKGNIIYQKSFGKADLEKKLPLNSESVFELASVSKQFTAMGIMILKKQNKLSYDDSLRKFFPELPYHNITVLQLLQHTSGLPDYMPLFNEHWDSTKIAVNSDIIKLLSQYKPDTLFAPGAKWEYSNTGYALLASIIEKVSGKKFGEFLRKNIFEPLGMKRTQVYCRRYENRKIDNYAYGYVMDKKTNKFVLPDSIAETAILVYALDGIQGDGTVNSTTTDLLKWDRALYTEKLVSKKMMVEAFQPAKLSEGKTYGYGFGWSLGDIKSIGKIVTHTGGWPGYATLIEREIEVDKTIIILQNMETPRPSLINIRNILNGIKVEASKEISVKVSKLQDYVGEFELAPSFTITITVEADKIFAQATGQDKFELFSEKEDIFFLKVVEAKIKFIRDKDSKVSSIILYQGGQEVEGKKIK